MSDRVRKFESVGLDNLGFLFDSLGSLCRVSGIGLD